MHNINVEAARVDLPALAHELADLHYVVSGTAVQLGIDEAAVFSAVNDANMAKAGGGKDERGKARKPDGWRPADVAAVLRAQGWTGGEEPR
jgi:predicted HAD superfamily Cof-like phosphohydrolase